MPRWEPGAPERLQEAALELFATRGFDGTTTADIAESVGLSERTFFRHFADKREVLFHGQDRFLAAFLAGVGTAPDSATPLEIVGCALRAAAVMFPDDRRAHARVRRQVIDANAALRERERHKMADLADALASAIAERGVGRLAARLAGETATTVFTASFDVWLAEGEQRSLVQIAQDVLATLAGLTQPPAPA